MVVGFEVLGDVSRIYNLETEKLRGLLRTNARQFCKAGTSLTPFAKDTGASPVLCL